MLARILILTLAFSLLGACGEEAAEGLAGSWKFDLKTLKSSPDFKAMGMEEREALRSAVKDLPRRLVIDEATFRLGDDRWDYSVKTDDGNGTILLELKTREGETREMLIRVRKDKLFIVDEKRPLAFLRRY